MMIIAKGMIITDNENQIRFTNAESAIIIDDLSE